MIVRSLVLRLLICSGAVFGGTPAFAWERDIAGACGGGASVIAVTQPGDVIAAGMLCTPEVTSAHKEGFGAVKLRSDTGDVLWQRVLGGEAHDLAVDARGNAVVAGAGRRRDTSPFTFTAIKLAAATGTIRWRHDVRRGIAFAVAVGRHRDVFVAGSLGLDNGVDNRNWTVQKLSAINGTERWREVIRGGL